jgi:HPr kinase/phosphorylase
MELIKKGHIFVCDDATDVTNIGGRLFGRPNAVSNKFIEVRGMGILSVSKMFGIEKTQPSCDIDIVINFVKDSDYVSKPFERIGKQLNFETIESVKVASYNLPVTPGRKMSDLVETVVVDFKLKQEGYYSAKEYIEQFKKVNQKI